MSKATVTTSTTSQKPKPHIPKITPLPNPHNHPLQHPTPLTTPPRTKIKKIKVLTNPFSHPRYCTYLRHNIYS